MDIRYIDVHSHIHFPEFDADRDTVLARMKEHGVGTITIGVDLESSRRAVAFAEQHDDVWAAIGGHPHDTFGFVFNPEDFEELVKHPKVVAIGECGLDYYRLAGDGESEKARQKFEFQKQIEFAVKHDKPLMMHIRDAHDDAYEILKSYPKARGNLHFFTESAETAQKFIDLGFTVSFPGVVTFARETHDAVQSIPLTAMHAETDAPYAAPIPHRGKRNEPVYVIEVVKKIAELRGEDVEKVRLQLLENARTVFGII